jgi:two-component system, OmpR family, response regulator
MTKPFALIIEDDPQLSRVFSLTLQADFETEVIEDGSAALQRLTTIKPTVVLLDLNLPGASGRSILAAIRADVRLAGTHVILCTADERQADSLNEEADIVLLKPVSPAQLRQIASRFA